MHHMKQLSCRYVLKNIFHLVAVQNKVKFFGFIMIYIDVIKIFVENMFMDEAKVSMLCLCV